MNEQGVLGYVRKEQDKKSSMGIYTPSDCKLSNLKIEPLMILHAPTIVHELGVFTGWVFSAGLLRESQEARRLYVERGAISELAVDVMFRSLYLTSVEWSGLFNFADYDFVREGNKRITIGVTSSRQTDMETYTIRQATGANLKGNPAIHYSCRKIDRLPDYLIGVSVKSTNAGSDVAIWGAIMKRRLTLLMKKLDAKELGLRSGNDVWLPLRVNEVGLKGFNHQDFISLLTALGCNEDLQSIEAKTNEELKAIADRTKQFYADATTCEDSRNYKRHTRRQNRVSEETK